MRDGLVELIVALGTGRVQDAFDHPPPLAHNICFFRFCSRDYGVRTQCLHYGRYGLWYPIGEKCLRIPSYSREFGLVFSWLVQLKR